MAGNLMMDVSEEELYNIPTAEYFHRRGEFLNRQPTVYHVAIPTSRISGRVAFCSSSAFGFLALGRAGFAVNHMDIAPRYAGIVMGVSNIAGTIIGIVGAGLTGKLLEAAQTANSDFSAVESWRLAFFIPGCDWTEAYWQCVHKRR